MTLMRTSDGLPRWVPIQPKGLSQYDILVRFSLKQSIKAGPLFNAHNMRLDYANTRLNRTVNITCWGSTPLGLKIRRCSSNCTLMYNDWSVFLMPNGFAGNYVLMGIRVYFETQVVKRGHLFVVMYRFRHHGGEWHAWAKSMNAAHNILLKANGITTRSNRPQIGINSDAVQSMLIEMFPKEVDDLKSILSQTK